MAPINRIIHIVWFNLGKGDKPYGKYLKGYNAWIQQNPECEVKLWSKEAVIELMMSDPLYSRYLLPFFKLREPIQQVDMVRPLILHKYGGIYGDLDLICSKSVEPLFQLAEEHNKIITMKSHTPMREAPTNSFYVGPQGHDFWLYYLDRMSKTINEWKWFRKSSYITIMLMTGTQSLWHAIQGYGRDAFLIINPKKLFPRPDMFTPEAFGVDHLVSGYGPEKPIFFDALRILAIILLLVLTVCLLYRLLAPPKKSTPNVLDTQGHKEPTCVKIK